jgi:glycosyltransferase involved in cell wall biosynthesis
MTNTRYRVLITDANEAYAGGEFYVFELARSLQARGFGVRVACKPSNLLLDKCERERIPVVPVDFPHRGGLTRNIGELRSIIARDGTQIVHTNTNYDRTSGAVAARLAGVKHVTNVHSLHSVQHNLTHWLRNRYATDRFIVDGYCVRDLLHRHDRLPLDRISVVPLGVDPASMRRDEGLRARIRAEFGFTPSQRVIGNVARLVPFKGHDVLLNAFARTVQADPDARLVLVGDGEREGELKGLAAGLGIGGAVMFAGFRDDLPALYSGFDIYVHASVEGGGETFPFAVLQALAQELPVVATRVGDVAEMVLDGESGFLVADRDPGALAAALGRLLADSGLRAAMAQKGRAHLLKNFTTERMIGRIEEIYRSLFA